MNELAMYLLKSAIWIALFWIVWRLFLHNEKFFRFNRLFLFSGLAASLLLPFCKYTSVQKLTLPMPLSSPVSENISVIEHSFDWRLLIFGIYLFGVLVCFIYFVFGLLKIRKLTKNAVVQKEKNLKVLNLSEIESSFSFLNYIFINNYPGISDTEKKIVLSHEQVHAEQKHWIDVLLAQSILSVQWFNPFMYLYMKAVKQNHEFLADEAVLSEGNSPAVYQAVLINSTLKTPVFSFVNSFAYPNKNKRITMMKKKTSNRLKKVGTLLLIPALAIFLWAFAEKKYEISYAPEKEVNLAVSVINIEDEEASYFHLQKDSAKIKKKTSVRLRIQENPGDSTKKVTAFAVSDSGDIRNIEDLLVIVDGKEVESSNEVIVTTCDSTNTIVKLSTVGKPLYIVDGKEIKSLESVSPDQIESVDVLKDSSAIEVYGEKGKNGVILITTKEKEYSIENNDADKRFNRIIVRSATGNLVEPLYIIDGRVVKSIDNISPETIESITVLKDKAATEMYGEKAKNGVIIVSLKK